LAENSDVADLLRVLLNESLGESIMPDQDFTIWVITEDIPAGAPVPKGARDAEDTGGGWGVGPETGTVKRIPMDALALKVQMEGLIRVVGDLFTTSDAQAGMQLNEVQLSVTISADGKVNILGSGGGLANSGGITLKFARRSSDPT
jgi:hypothetical protein